MNKSMYPSVYQVLDLTFNNRKNFAIDLPILIQLEFFFTLSLLDHLLVLGRIDRSVNLHVKTCSDCLFYIMQCINRHHFPKVSLQLCILPTESYTFRHWLTLLQCEVSLLKRKKICCLFVIN